MVQTTTHYYNSIKDLIVRKRQSLVLLNHLFLTVIANYCAFLIRFEGTIPRNYFLLFLHLLPILLIIRLTLHRAFGLQKDLWRYSSINDLVKLGKTITIGTVLFVLLARFVLGHEEYPRSVYIIDWMLMVLLSGSMRLLIRVFREYTQSEPIGKKVLIIGAGDAGEMVLRDMKSSSRYNYNPLGFIDDDPYKQGLSIHGLPILGTVKDIERVIEDKQPEEILIAMPSAGTSVIKDIYNHCKNFDIPVKTLPRLSDIVHGRVTVSQIKPLSLEDLLQRETVRTDIEEVRQYLEGKRILVTGAGGSIGSELCRQIYKYKPSALILFDQYENGLFSVDMELQRQNRAMKEQAGGHPALITVVGDMTNRRTVEVLFSEHRPQIVFHAAAHKHVPLMETNPLEAVKNNVFGTMNLLDEASQNGVENFLMISTDKAVNPTSVMGATKRVAEFLSLSRNRKNRMNCNAVRFGNVLGSNGSVVHIFQEQLKSGGPLTVTHPDIKRFFMLIPEAVQLVLIAASAGLGGEIFVLEMGEQIRIADLAENLIRLSGLIPGKDIQIEYTGLRPGEKLYEELFDESEAPLPSFHPKLHIAKPSITPSPEELGQHVSELAGIIARNATAELIPALQKIVPNYKKIN